MTVYPRLTQQPKTNVAAFLAGHDAGKGASCAVDDQLAGVLQSSARPGVSWKVSGCFSLLTPAMPHLGIQQLTSVTAWAGAPAVLEILRLS